VSSDATGQGSLLSLATDLKPITLTLEALPPRSTPVAPRWRLISELGVWRASTLLKSGRSSAACGGLWVDDGVGFFGIQIPTTSIWE